ncbi:gastrula zinc finger protein XlCGF57.1 [Patella vulgata]|uniref:gastrula zinc finger protein XlCGF57.1 n=1 Tax=Patella vulgata TaxID=6465 RepID=UPI00217FB434|nr:gastrula zinc finger protein XlCGF57.1 [Patella vulgata]XP_050416397.1 gastrula zinc finger protein XlCGF57.1 [Patella vulgata]
MEDIQQNTPRAMTNFLESLKYFIETREDRSPTDSQQTFYFITVSTKLKIPINLKSEILAGRNDWIDIIEFSDTRFEHLDKIPVTDTCISKREIQNAFIMDALEIDKSSTMINNQTGDDINVDHTGENSDYDGNFNCVEEQSKDQTTDIDENISDTLTTPVFVVPIKKKRKCARKKGIKSGKKNNSADKSTKVVNKNENTQSIKKSKEENIVAVPKKPAGMKLREPKKYSCEYCGETFLKLDIFKAHLSIHGTEHLFKCTFCPLSVKSESVLKNHLLIHSGIRPFTCDICGKSFTLKSTLKIHMRSHTGEKPYVCHICGLSFKRCFLLKLHVLKHSGVRPWQCEYCPKTFASKFEVKCHTRCHTDILKFQCDICGKKFRTKGGLAKHITTHSDEKPFACTLCDSRFVNKVYLKNHIKTHSTSQNYTCEICGKRLKTLWSLKKHRQIHSDARPFKCDICQKDFKLMYVLQQHAKMHQDVKEYKCQYCEKLFTFNSSLYSHLKVHHKNKQKEKIVMTAKPSTKSLVIELNQEESLL